MVASLPVASAAHAASAGGAQPHRAPAVAKPARGGVATTPAQISTLQRALHVRADGVLGPITRAALRRAEHRAGLRADGVPRLTTLARLNVAMPRASSAPTANPVAVSGAHSPLVAAARTRIGSPYSWGSTGPSAFDCSGLVQWAANRIGVSVPRTTWDQVREGQAVTRGEIEPGDLVFFDTGGPGPSDVGIASSATTAISATVHGGVMEHPIFDSYWGSHFLQARRLS